MSVPSVSAPGTYSALNLGGSLPSPPPGAVGGSQSLITSIAPTSSAPIQVNDQTSTIQAGIAHAKESPVVAERMPRYEGDPSSVLVVTSGDNKASNKVSPALKATIGVDCAVITLFVLSPLIELLPRRMRRNIEDTPGTLACARKNLGAQKRGAADAAAVLEKNKQEYEANESRQAMNLKLNTISMAVGTVQKNTEEHLQNTKEHLKNTEQRMKNIEASLKKPEFQRAGPLA